MMAVRHRAVMVGGAILLGLVWPCQRRPGDLCDHDRARLSHMHAPPSSSPEGPALPDPHLHEQRTLDRELIPHRLILLAVGHMAERDAIDPGQDPPVSDEMINELGERVVPSAPTSRGGGGGSGPRGTRPAAMSSSCSPAIVLPMHAPRSRGSGRDHGTRAHPRLAPNARSPQTESSTLLLSVTLWGLTGILTFTVRLSVIGPGLLVVSRATPRSSWS